eukprot:gene10437-2771_t
MVVGLLRRRFSVPPPQNVIVINAIIRLSYHRRADGSLVDDPRAADRAVEMLEELLHQQTGHFQYVITWGTKGLQFYNTLPDYASKLQWQARTGRYGTWKYGQAFVEFGLDRNAANDGRDALMFQHWDHIHRLPGMLPLWQLSGRRENHMMHRCVPYAGMQQLPGGVRPGKPSHFPPLPAGLEYQGSGALLQWRSLKTFNKQLRESQTNDPLGRRLTVEFLRPDCATVTDPAAICPVQESLNRRAGRTKVSCAESLRERRQANVTPEEVRIRREVAWRVDAQLAADPHVAFQQDKMYQWNTPPVLSRDLHDRYKLQPFAKAGGEMMRWESSAQHGIPAGFRVWCTDVVPYTSSLAEAPGWVQGVPFHALTNLRGTCLYYVDPVTQRRWWGKISMKVYNPDFYAFERTHGYMRTDHAQSLIETLCPEAMGAVWEGDTPSQAMNYFRIPVFRETKLHWSTDTECFFARGEWEYVKISALQHFIRHSRF